MTDPTEALVRAIEEELGRIRALTAEAAKIPDLQESLAKRAMASILQDFYNACERIFHRIATDLEGGVPENGEWYRRLLASMAMAAAGVRPAVISPEMASTLDEYLGFRHVFRNIYGYELEGERLRRLSRELPETAQRLERELSYFLRWLRSGRG
jgi:uncharacterized protein YutE (UPF0331/DUF86 family)